MKETTTKITVHVSTVLLQQARAITGQGVTGTVRPRTAADRRR